jgi:hypothetical protein
VESGFQGFGVSLFSSHRNDPTAPHQKTKRSRLKQLSHRQKVDRPRKSPSNERRIKVTQVITGEDPWSHGNIPRSPDFDPANGGKNSSHKIHHRPVRQIDHTFFLADRSMEPEQYSTLNYR